jgi:LacI family transcriptional regulator
VTVSPVAAAPDTKPGAAPRHLHATLPARRATIYLVAQTARVSTSTVSRCLNGGYVSASLRARVTQAIADLEFAPSFTARSLKAGRSGRIGVVCASIQSAGFTRILAGVEEQLAKAGQSVLLASLDLDSERSDPPDKGAVADWIRGRRVDGIIFVASTAREQSLISAARSAGLPVVMIAPRFPAQGHCSLRCDNVRGGRLIAQHLLDGGHRRIAFVRGAPEAMDTRDRLRGMREMLHRARAELLVVDRPRANPEDYAAGREHAREYLARSSERRPTAVVLATDLMALGFLRGVLERGLNVPRDVAVAGFDGIPLGALYYPGLTTVAQPAELMGAAACQVLFERIKRKNLDGGAPLEHEVLLIERESTGAPRSREV